MPDRSMRFVRCLIALYPTAWRARYEDEMLALVGESALSPAVAADLVAGALREWVRELGRMPETPQDLRRETWRKALLYWGLPALGVVICRILPYRTTIEEAGGRLMYLLLVPMGLAGVRLITLGIRRERLRYQARMRGQEPDQAAIARRTISRVEAGVWILFIVVVEMASVVEPDSFWPHAFNAVYGTGCWLSLVCASTRRGVLRRADIARLRKTLSTPVVSS